MSCLGLAGSLAILAAQAPLVFPTSAELVYVVTSVTDGSGHPIRGLRAEDFTVSEDGKPREITTLVSLADASTQGGTVWPIDFVLLLDTSGSMKKELRRARDAAVEFANSVPAVRGRNIVSFDSRIRMWPYEEAGPAPVLDEILSDEEIGGTRLFDAMLESIPRVAKDPTRRPIMVALTDGEDTGALERFMNPDDPVGRTRFLLGLDLQDRLVKQQSQPVAEIASALQNESVTFYAISFAKHLENGFPSGDLRAAHGRDTLKALAKATGGLVVDGDARDLTTQFGRIRDDLAAQYVLGFVPGPSVAGKIHKLRIAVAPRGAKVRHRLAYQTKPPG